MIYITISHRSSFWLTFGMNDPFVDKLSELTPPPGALIQVNDSLLIRAVDFTNHTRIMFNTEEDKVEFILKYM